MCSFLTSRHSRDSDLVWTDELQQSVLTVMVCHVIASNLQGAQTFIIQLVNQKPLAARCTAMW